MPTGNAARVRSLLKGIETGDPKAVEVIHPDRYIQHNPQTHEGREGLATLFKRLATTNPRVNIVRAFEDGDYVFAHTEYDFATRRIGFEVFRFEDGLAVEHWDNIQPRQGPNATGRSMVDGPVTAEDHEHTETNRALVRTYTDDVLIQRRLASLAAYIGGDAGFTQHSPVLPDGLDSLRSALEEMAEDGTPAVAYTRIHRVLAEGSFVLTVCEGSLRGTHTAFYDLYRVDAGRIVEHWDTRESIPPVGEWKNDNGKF